MVTMKMIVMWDVQYTGTADAYSFLDVNRTAADAPAFAKGLTSAVIEGMDRLYAAGETSVTIFFNKQYPTETTQDSNLPPMHTNSRVYGDLPH
jgi:hypothetical protein